MPNEIKLYGDIGEGGITCQMVKTQLAKMDATQPLIVRIDSFGGSVFDGLSMYEAFASYPGPKKAIIETSAFSIASYIAMAFDEVEIASNGYLMIHSPYVDGAGGTSEELINMAELGVKIKQDMVRAYSTKAGISESDALALMSKDTYLNAEEALSKGLVDRINEARVSPKVRPQARHQHMPQRVYAALFGAGSSGENPESSKEKTMSEGPVAATLQEIEAAFPKAKAEFVIKCLKKSMPMASVAAAAAEELMTENEELKAQVAAMEEELTALKAKAEEEPPAEEEEEEPPVEAKAKARGAKPVARASSAATKSAKEEWDAAIAAALPTAKNRAKAVAQANRQHPGLRQRMLAEVNAR